jgi:hypothetical protein
VLGGALACVTGLGVLRTAAAAATVAEARTPLKEDEPAARALAYVADATRVDARQFTNYRRGQSCTTCSQIEFGTARQRPCKLIPGKLVNAGGWCKVWVGRGG